MGLRLLTIALVAAGDRVLSSPALLALVRGDLCLLLVCLSDGCAGRAAVGVGV